MKKPVVLLSILALSSTCIAQENNTYSQRIEYGLKENVKEVTTFVCKISDNTIPADTTNFFAKYTTTFDQAGMIIASNKVWNLGAVGNLRESKTINFSKGRDISYKNILTLEDGYVDVKDYEYQWVDDYHYMILDKSDSNYSQSIWLNKNFKITKDVMKHGNIEFVNEIETVYKNDRMEKIVTYITEKRDDDIFKEIQILIMKTYDKHGNPTLVHSYDHIDEKQVNEVIFKKYTYY